ncbi:hypothetical protein JW905_19005 [bacterium]|nr:hypothetical protein [candidate division CSSED10-310 bacterium]
MEGYLLEDRIAEIVDWFSGFYTSPDGFPYFELDGDTGTPIGCRTLIAELGDYLPFLLHCGAESYVDAQLKLFTRRFETTYPLFTRPVTRNIRGVRLALPGGRSPAYTDILDYSEILFGLIECARETGNDALLTLAHRVFEQVEHLFLKNDRFYSWRLVHLKRRFPLCEPLSGMIIEAAVDLYDSGLGRHYLDVAAAAARVWIQSPFFTRHRVFPSGMVHRPFIRHLPKFRSVTGRAELCKANTSMVWALEALHRSTGEGEWLEALRNWEAGLRSKFGSEEGGFYQFAALPGHTPIHNPILSTNFAVLEFYVDMFVATTDQKMLHHAMLLADFWLARQSGVTGLFPDESDRPISYLDGNTDLIIALLKVWEVSGEERYRQSARRALKGILRFHRCDFGYVREVEMNTGNTTNSLIETRFVSLLLKVLLVFAKDWSITGKNGCDSLVRDR